MSQASEIQAICKRLGLTPAQLADRVPMKAETMRKVVRGYQPASERTMQHIRNVERMMTLTQGAPPVGAVAGPSPYGIMKRETLQRNFVEVAEKLEQARPADRRTILNNLKAMLEELDRREVAGNPAPGGALTEAQNIALQASQNLTPPRTPAGEPLPGKAEPPEGTGSPPAAGSPAG